MCSELQVVIQPFAGSCQEHDSLTAHEFLKLGGKVFNSKRR